MIPEQDYFDFCFSSLETDLKKIIKKNKNLTDTEMYWKKEEHRYNNIIK